MRVMIATLALTLALAACGAGGGDTSDRDRIQAVYDCIQEQDDPSVCDTEGEPTLEPVQAGLDDAGDVNGDGIDQCILWATEDAEYEACYAAGSERLSLEGAR